MKYTSTFKNRPRMPFIRGNKPMPPSRREVIKFAYQNVDLGEKIINYDLPIEERVQLLIDDWMWNSGVDASEIDRIKEKRSEFMEECKDWNPEDFDGLNAEIKPLTMKQLLDLCPKDVPLEDISIDLVLEQEYMEKFSFDGLHLTWRVNETPERIAELEEEYERIYQTQLVNYQEDLVRYQQAEIAYEEEMKTFPEIMKEWRDNLHPEALKDYLEGKVKYVVPYKFETTI